MGARAAELTRKLRAASGVICWGHDIAFNYGCAVLTVCQSCDHWKSPGVRRSRNGCLRARLQESHETCTADTGGSQHRSPFGTLCPDCFQVLGQHRQPVACCKCAVCLLQRTRSCLPCNGSAPTARQGCQEISRLTCAAACGHGSCQNLPSRAAKSCLLRPVAPATCLPCCAQGS